jgi:soluble lytic murein transglycosylase-like protein
VNFLQVLVVILAVGVVILTGAILLRSSRPIPPRAIEGDPFEQMIRSAATKAGVPLEVFVRLLLSESELNPLATGPENQDGSVDKGIGQLNSYYIAWFGEKYAPGQVLDPYDPSQALPVAAYYLADLADMFKGCWACAVGGYKRGPTGWARVLKRGSPGHSYVDIGGGHSCE